MNKTYLLDTNIISYLTDSNSPHREKIKNKLFSLEEQDKVAVSIITLYELSYGLATLQHTEHKKLFENAISFIKDYLDVYPLNIEEIDIFGQIKAKYKKQTGINTKALKKNDLDFLIASTAISQNIVLVSNDKIFEDIAEFGFELCFENWV